MDEMRAANLPTSAVGSVSETSSLLLFDAGSLALFPESLDLFPPFITVRDSLVSSAMYSSTWYMLRAPSASPRAELTHRE